MADSRWIVDRVALKKEAKRILDNKTFFMVLCYALYGVIVAACFAFCFFVPNPLESLAVDLLAGTFLFTEVLDYEVLELIAWCFFKFFRLILFFALAHPVAICVTSVPVTIVEGKDVTWEIVLKPVGKGRYFIEYMIAGASKFLRTFLWSILLIVPGIAAYYNYSFSKYIFLKDNELSSGDAISKSKKLAYGVKTQLFSLDMSFAGWFVFGICTCGIGFLYLTCYYSVTKVLFFKKICELKGGSASASDDDGAAE